MDVEAVHKLLLEGLRRAGLHDIELEVLDESDGCGQNLRIVVVSDLYEGIPLLKRQRKIHEVLSQGDVMKVVHSVVIKCWTRKQRDKRQRRGGSTEKVGGGGAKGEEEVLMSDECGGEKAIDNNNSIDQ